MRTNSAIRVGIVVPREVAYAAFHDGEIDVLRKWLDEGGDPNAFCAIPAERRHTGQIPQSLITKAASGAPKCLALLIERGGDVTRCDALGTSPLHWAMSMPWTTAKCINMLIEAGADPNLLDGFTGSTPLMKIDGSTPWDALCALLRHGAVADAKDWCLVNTEERLLGLIDPAHSDYARAGFEAASRSVDSRNAGRGSYELVAP